MKSRLLPLPLVLILLSTSAAAHIDDGQMYLADYANDRVYFVDAGKTWGWLELAIMTPVSDAPGAIGFSHHGDLLVANNGDDNVWEFDGEGGIKIVLDASDGIDGVYGASGITLGPGHGDLYFTKMEQSEILFVHEDYTNPSVFADASDGLVAPTALEFLPDGNLLVVDRGTKNVLHFDPTGVATFFDAFVDVPVDIAIRKNGDLYVLTDVGDIYRYVGGDPASKVKLATYGSGDGSLAFTPDHTILYHVNPIDGAVRSVDPETGAATVEVTLPGSPVAMAVASSQFAFGTYAEIGEPLPGTGGVGPRLFGVGEPRIGTASRVEMRDFVGAAPIALFFAPVKHKASLFGGDFHLGFNGLLIMDLFVASGTPGVAGDGEADFDFLIPADPVLVGSRWYWQALGYDVGAIQSASMTDGLLMYLGE